MTSAKQFYFFPSKKMGIIIGTNTDNFIFLHKLANGLLALYLGHDFANENESVYVSLPNPTTSWLVSGFFAMT